MRRVVVAAVVAVVLGALQLAYALAVAEEPLFYGSSSLSDVRIDVTLYRIFAMQYAAGRVPYRDYPVEYPPLAVALFILNRHFAPLMPGFGLLLAVEMFAANALALALVVVEVGRDGTPGVVARRLLWYTLALGSLCPMAVYRFDLLAMAWMFAAAVALSSGRPVWGGLLAGTGVFVKFVPGVVIVPALAAGGPGAGRPFRVRALLSFAAALAAGTAGWLLVGGSRVGRTFTYHALRGVEVGSLYAGVVMLAAKWLGAPLRVVTLHSGVTVQAPWSETASSLALPLQAAALAVTTWRAWRVGREEPLRYSAATVLAFVAFGKVLSPQYLLWLIPFVACLRGRTGRWARGLYLAACVATTLIFPLGFAGMLELRTAMILLVNARNALLIALWTLLTFGPSSVSRIAAIHTGGTVVKQTR